MHALELSKNATKSVMVCKLEMPYVVEIFIGFETASFSDGIYAVKVNPCCSLSRHKFLVVETL